MENGNNRTAYSAFHNRLCNNKMTHNIKEDVLKRYKNEKMWYSYSYLVVCFIFVIEIKFLQEKPDQVWNMKLMLAGLLPPTLIGLNAHQGWSVKLHTTLVTRFLTCILYFHKPDHLCKEDK